jgi:hypothetical protein
MWGDGKALAAGHGAYLLVCTSDGIRGRIEWLRHQISGNGMVSGGVAAEPVMTDVFRIVSRGNAYTGQDRVQDFTLLKAAETTIAAGGNYFLILSAADRTAVESGQTPSTVHTNFVGQTAYTTVTPGVSYNMIKPGESTLIRVLRVKPGEAPPPGAFQAQDIVNTIGPRLKATS